MAKKRVLFFLAMAILMLVNPGNCGLNILANSSFVLVYDGVREFQQPDFIVLDLWPSSDHSSHSQRTVSGNIFLILVYISLMLFAAKLMYDGSELLVEVASPRISGGVFLPLLGSVLDAIISFVSNLCGNKETAQNDKVSVGTYLLTGSTAMLLILLWGSCIIDGSALRTDLMANHSARTMVISVMPFIAVQLSQVLGGTSPISLVVLISLIVSVSLLLAYCLYQVFHPSILKRRLANGEPGVEDIRKLFEVIGKNSDQLFLSASELRVLKGIQIKDKDPAIDDTKISIDILIREISKWLNKGKNSAVLCSGDNDLKTRLVVAIINKEHELRGVQSNPKWSTSKAVLMLALGSLITAIFAGPLINSVDNFSTAANIPPFLFPFAALPFALSSEAVSAVMFASQNKWRISLTSSKIYGAVSMNNLLCLSVFLGLLYFRHLTWNFTSELLIILIVWSFLPRNMGWDDQRNMA